MEISPAAARRRNVKFFRCDAAPLRGKLFASGKIRHLGLEYAHLRLAFEHNGKQ